MLGHLIADRYQILEVLGSGNMTKTYLVKDLHHPDYAKCVIKHLIPSQADSDWLTASSQLFAKEAESLKTLGSHSNIPKLLDYFEHQEAFYLVQEFIDGHPLSAELTIGERWEVAEVLQFLKDMLTLLVFVHDQGMIHRDVKPSNIMRRQSDNQLVLIDFGAVKQVPARQPKADGKTSVTVVVGTPGYMSSEQANGKPQPNSDVYSLGMIAIQALTGLLPRQLREDEEGEWVWQEQAEVDDGLAAVLSKMVRHHHKRRLQTAADALEVLQTLQQPVPAVASSDRTSHPTLCQPHEVANTDSDTAAAVPPQPDKAMPSASPSKTPTVRAVPQAITRAPVTTITSQPRPTVWRRSRWAVVGAAAIVLATAVPGIAYLMHTKNLSEHERQVLHLDDLQQDGQYGVCLETAAALPNMNETWTKAAQVIITKCETGKAQTDALEAIENFQSKGDLEACIEAAQDFPAPTTTALAEEAGQYLGRCQLSQARQLAQTGSFANGIAIANSIESESESYGEAQKLLAQWSYRILDLAEESYAKDGDMDTAETFIAAIPEQTAAYPTAQTALAQLREDYERNQAALTAARNAFDEERWEDAIVAAGKLTLASTQVEKDYIITQSRKILSEEIEPFLDETSVLTTNRTGSFGRPYEEHTFDGEAGKTVVIMMESDQFDTLVQLIGPDGNEVARDDDRGRNDLNSSITIPLEASGTYLIRSQAYYRNGQGEYRLTARYLPEQ